MNATLARLGDGIGRLLRGPDRLLVEVGPEGPAGDFEVPSAGDGEWETTLVQGRSCLRPTESSYYLYCALPEAFRRRAAAGLWVEVEYHGPHYGEFRLQYASSDRAQPWDGLYKAAEQRWQPEAVGLRRFRRAVFHLPDFDPGRTQNEGASFRLEFRRELLVSRVAVGLAAPPDLEAFPAVAPLPELRKMPGRLYPVNYLFVEITNACNFKCTWCPDEIMGRRRGFMKKERVFRIFDEIAEKRSWLGPIYPVKLHQMGEPMLHPDLPEIVAHAEALGVGIELNTNCGLITAERMEALYRAGLTNLILSYQTPDEDSFKTRKAPKLVFDEYRDKVRLAVERKVALGARTNIEIDIMNTKHADGYRIVSEDEQALAFLADWIGFCQELEKRHGLRAAAPRLGQDPQRALPRPGRERQPLHPPRRRAPRLEALPQLGQRHRGARVGGRRREGGGRGGRPRVEPGDPAARDGHLLPRAARPVRGAVERGRGELLHGLRGPHQDRQRLRHLGGGRLARPDAARPAEGHARGAPPRRVRAMPGAQVGR